MDELILLKKNEDSSSKLIGVHYQKNKITLVFPNYLPYQDDFKKTALNLIRAIEKYQNKRRYKSKFDASLGNNSVYQAYIYLIRYYYENGLYEEQEKISKLNQKGRINFSKTIQRIKPDYIDDSFVYSNVYYNINKISDNNAILEIMKYALKISFEKAGFLLGVSHNPFKSVNKVSTYYAIVALRRRIAETNNDKEIYIFNLILSVFLKEEANEAKEAKLKSVEVLDFDDMFSDMVYNVFNNYFYTKDKKEFEVFSNKEFKLVDGQEIIRKIGDKHYHVLTHYHKFDEVLPSKTDILKHLEISKKIDGNTIDVIFLAGKNSLFEVSGKVKAGDDEILICRINLEFLIKAYLGQANYLELNAIFDKAFEDDEYNGKS